MNTAAATSKANGHGLSSALTVFPQEDQEEFNQLLDDYRAEFQPGTEHEYFLVNQMVQSRWKQARAQRLQTVLVEKMSGAVDNTSPDTLIVAAMDKTGIAFVLLERQSAAAERSYYKAHHELEHGRARMLKRQAKVADTWMRQALFAPTPSQSAAEPAIDPPQRPAQPDSSQPAPERNEYEMFYPDNPERAEPLLAYPGSNPANAGSPLPVALPSH